MNAISTIIMRLLKYAARKSLLVLGYPKLEMSHPELGVYEVGAVRARMTPDVPACQFFYPVVSDKGRGKTKKNKKNNNSSKETYFRREAAEGLVKYLGGFGDGILQFLGEQAHPLRTTYGADPLTLLSNNGNYHDIIDGIDDEQSSSTSTTTTTTNKFPLVLFSHGLSGTMEMYSEICAQIASTGCVVVAVEHEDGTASYAETADGKPVAYKQPAPHAEIPYSRQKVINFRTSMLEERVEELRGIYDLFSNDDDEDQQHHPQSLLMQKIVSVTDPSRLHLAGHSFGGATQLLAAQTWRKEIATAGSTTTALASAGAADDASASSVDPGGYGGGISTATATTTVSPPQTKLPMPRSITTFDAWNFAMSEQVVRAGLGGSMMIGDDDNSSSQTAAAAPPQRLEVLSVLSENWATVNPEREQTQEFLRNCDPETVSVRSFYAKNSVHQSVCDTEAFLPSWLATKFGNRGRGERRHQTVRALVGEIAKFTSGTGATTTTTTERIKAIPTPPPPTSAERMSGDEGDSNLFDEEEKVLVEYPF